MRKLPKYYRKKNRKIPKLSNRSGNHYLFLLITFLFIATFIILTQQDNLKIPQKNVTVKIDITDKIKIFR
ncbi:MAG: hypothetical protein ACJAS6_001049 [Rickettsiales bacterium]|jgi:hypothetical protein